MCVLGLPVSECASEGENVDCAKKQLEAKFVGLLLMCKGPPGGKERGDMSPVGRKGGEGAQEGEGGGHLRNQPPSLS